MHIHVYGSRYYILSLYAVVMWFFVNVLHMYMSYQQMVHGSCNFICSYHIPCPRNHYTVLFLFPSFITRMVVEVCYKGRWTEYKVMDTDMVREVTEKKIKKEGVDVEDVDVVCEGARLDVDQQWWQISGNICYIDIYNKRWDVFT